MISWPSSLDKKVTAAENSITIVVPALNEERNLAFAVRNMVQAAERWFDQYEILVFNDGSTDKTGQIADALAAECECVLAFHHDRPKNMGGVIREGCRRARMNYVIWLDGKGGTTGEALDEIFSRKGQADLVIPYSLNERDRSAGRRAISRLFRKLLNVIFALRIRYYTGSIMSRASLVRQFTIRTNSYAWQAEALIKMVKSGCSYVHVGIRERYDNEGRCTKAFRLKNIIGVAAFLIRTLWDVYVRRDYRQAVQDGR
jgi:glycosyltransferase involved in cell wall biosynthesis